MLKGLLGDVRAICFDNHKERMGSSITRGNVSWGFLLSTLWTGVVKPVLHALAISPPRELLRIFGVRLALSSFLLFMQPKHVYMALNNRKPGHKVFDFVISSYVPTLSILALSPNPDVALSRPSTTFRWPFPDFQVWRQSWNLSGKCLLELSLGTVEEVLSRVYSGVRLMLPALTGSVLHATEFRMTRAQLIVAFVSPNDALGHYRVVASPGWACILCACQKAIDDGGLSDEAIHIAAGTLFAGYGGVVGTMWSAIGPPRVASDVSGRPTVSECTRPDYREVYFDLDPSTHNIHLFSSDRNPDSS